MNKIEFILKNRCGIYIFTNIINGKKYIGSSKDLYNRLHEHYHNLMNNKAHNKHFQASWNKNKENNFIYSILEFCDEDVRFEREQYYLDVINPEYNLTNQVIANFGVTPSDEVKLKISNTLKEKYASGEIKTYRQDHNWQKCYIYNVYKLTLVATCDCKNDAFRLLKSAERDNSVLKHALFHNKYCVSLEKFDTQSQLQNYVNEFVLTCISNKGKYLITENTFGELKYHRSIIECATYNNSSKSTLSKHTDSTRTNPYVIKQSQNKFYFSDTFIKIKETAVPIEESSELLQTNIGEGCDANTEINLDSNKSKSSYSIEIEPEISE